VFSVFLSELQVRKIIKMKLLLLAAVLLASSQAVIFDRPCRTTVEAKSNFLAIVYTGTWLELQTTDAENTAQCIVHHYTQRPVLGGFDVIRDGFANDRWHHETGSAQFAFPDETPLLGKFNATIDRVIGGPIFYNYQVVASDYSNYAITWSCTNLPNGQSREEGAILSRTTNFTAAVDQKVTDIISNLGFDRSEFRTIGHSPTE
jgi:retinol-binding protein 4